MIILLPYEALAFRLWLQVWGSPEPKAPECSLEGLLKLKLQYFGHLMRRADSLEKTLMLGKIESRKRRGWQRMRGWMASSTQWTWVWVNSGSWWWTGRPGVLQSMGLQRIWHEWVAELNWSEDGCTLGFPGGSDSKEPACNAGGPGSILGKILWRREWQSTPVFLPGEFHGQRSLVGYSPWGCKELDMTEYAHTHRRDEWWSTMGEGSRVPIF